MKTNQKIYERNDIEQMDLFQRDFILKAFDKLIILLGESVKFVTNGMAYKHFTYEGKSIRVRCEDGAIFKEQGFFWNYEWKQIGKIY